ncbi:MAG: 16S rRNA (uracil(1498)-N(3))-methyltransferase [Oscillospiraceae bacterium]|nr:16S rRNA (uracil(1498)-N(3))-methyltransferase [Oscillospiraceae bacterium]
MPRFFIEQPPLDGVITVRGSDARHISCSLRMKINDRQTFCHGGYDYLCVITAISEDEVVCEVKEAIPSCSEPNTALTLYQAFPKQDKFEGIVQKTIELGVKRIVPFMSRRCVSRHNQQSFQKKLTRYQRIAEEAAKQSGRGIIPEVSALMTFEEALEDMKKSEIRLICYENGGKRLSETVSPNARSIAVMVGSEGGFERGEFETAVSSGVTPIGLGERILRCETCPVAVTAILMYITGEV